MRVLFMAVFRPDRVPAQRFRFEQYLGHLRASGITCDFSWVLGERDEEVFYGWGGFTGKAFVAFKALTKRLAETARFHLGQRYDAVFVQRQALFIGPPFVEWLAKHSGSKLVFDFDDAIWLRDVSASNRRFAWLKDTRKIPHIIEMSDLVLAGNEYLAGYARSRNRNVEVVPTTIDTDAYQPAPKSAAPDHPVCVGWSGSMTTVEHFRTARAALRRLRKRFRDRITFKVIGDPRYRDDELQIAGQPWRRETEVEDLRELDIGIMPLPDDEWSRGKCGLKGLQYMGLAIPTLMSPVGVNAEIITHGTNGFLPETEDDWVEQIARLVEDPGERRRVGDAGRATVVDRYSVRAWRDRYCELLTRVAAG